MSTLDCNTKARKERNYIATSQINILNSYYNINPRPCRELVEQIALDCKLPKKSVRIWFQNKRTKMKLAGYSIDASYRFINCKSTVNPNPYQSHHVQPNYLKQSSSFINNDIYMNYEQQSSIYSRSNLQVSSLQQSNNCDEHNKPLLNNKHVYLSINTLKHTDQNNEVNSNCNNDIENSTQSESNPPCSIKNLLNPDEDVNSS